jgi:hypothetical protein
LFKALQCVGKEKSFDDHCNAFFVPSPKCSSRLHWIFSEAAIFSTTPSGRLLRLETGTFLGAIAVFCKLSLFPGKPTSYSGCIDSLLLQGVVLIAVTGKSGSFALNCTGNSNFFRM